MIRSRGNHHTPGENTDGGGEQKSKGNANEQGLQRAAPCCDDIPAKQNRCLSGSHRGVSLRPTCCFPTIALI
jgi:hypothetical protein